MNQSKIFIAYANTPSVIGQTIEKAITGNSNVTSWKALDIYGHFIAEKVIEGINGCNIFIADISVLNFNVTYEIGYAIGKKKRILLIKNTSLQETEPLIREVGIFDTLVS
jgi:nucleoside 2-deoxyribosyltransferase